MDKNDGQKALVMQGKFTMVLPSAVRLGRFLPTKAFFR
jgi:hypothetical protein